MLGDAAKRSNGLAILCVDEDATALQFRKLILERNGYLVIGAISASQALAFFRQSHFDLVVSSFHLGEETAVSMLSIMRHMQPNTPAVLVANPMSLPVITWSEVLLAAMQGPAALLSNATDLHDIPTQPLETALNATTQIEAILESLVNQFEGRMTDAVPALLPSGSCAPRPHWAEVLNASVILPAFAALTLGFLVFFEISRAPADPLSRTTQASMVPPARNTPATSPQKERISAVLDELHRKHHPMRSVALNVAASHASASSSPVRLLPAVSSTSRPTDAIAPPSLKTTASVGLLPILAITSTHPPAAVQVAPRADFVLEQTVKAHSGWVTSVKFSADGQHLLSGSWDETVKMWGVTTGEEVKTIARHIKGLQALAITHDGRLLAAEDSTNTIRIWDTAAPGKPRELMAKSGPEWSRSWVYSIAFSPNGRWLASGIGGRTVRIWDAATGRVVQDLAAAKRTVVYIGFSPNNRWIVSGCDDKTLRIWDVETGKVVQTLAGHTDVVYAAAFSGDGHTLASASKDRTVKLWDVSTGRILHTLHGHRSFVTSLAFSPQGNWLVSGSWDNDLKIWNVGTGQLMQTLSGNTHPVYSVAFAPGGNWIASGSEDGTIKIWRRLKG